MLTLANQLTIFRMVMIPLLITLLLGNLHGWALLVFILAGVTDALDGLIARRYRQSSNIGAFLDPMADKLLMTACFIVLALPDHPKSVPEFHMPNHIPLSLTIVAISRDVFIVIIALSSIRFVVMLDGTSLWVILVLAVGFVAPDAMFWGCGACG